MLHINPVAMVDIAREHGWLHESGRLAGTINAAQMALGLGVAKTTVTRAYDGGAAGIVLLEKLQDLSGLPLDALVERRPDAGQEPAA
ncbi:hypothetical protein G3H63_09400 [Microbacterium resistens]|uniref:hypothetical protein n=1 Tax=Microbacterium resistens TaxID=156977 RepID=UPI001C57398D|nr:hypothetical protein [Microbacterium resistens]MBW1639285.1 hypothetical protein [Microbacterium resistens]